MLLRCIFLFSFCVQCYAIPPDYYSLGHEHSELNDKNLENQRSYILEEPLTTSNVTLSSSYLDSEYGEDENDFIEIYVATQKSHKKHYMQKIMNERSTKTSVKVENSTDKIDYSKILRKHTDPTNTSSGIRIFKSYDYVYNDEDIEQVSPKHRHMGYKKGTAQPAQEVNNSTAVYDSVLLFDNKTLNYLPKFYNLEPAAGVLDNKKHTDKSVHKDKVWYVPEKYPCWELPIIYGELGRKKQISEVFLVYFSRLTNVIDDNPKTVPVLKKYFIADPAKVVNKWCAVSPCYGDHTLCLFSRKAYSRICDTEYKVYSPSMSEQMALINTINSMRNSVARGTAEEYSHLPPAANMKQIIYDFDLEEMAKVWLRQCLPGIAPCSSLENEYIIQLECTKYADYCCFSTHRGDSSVNW